MLKAFIFDLGNVLLLFSHERIFEQIGACAAATRPMFARRDCAMISAVNLNGAG